MMAINEMRCTRREEESDNDLFGISNHTVNSLLILQ